MACIRDSLHYTGDVQGPINREPDDKLDPSLRPNSASSGIRRLYVVVVDSNCTTTSCVCVLSSSSSLSTSCCSSCSSSNSSSSYSSLLSSSADATSTTTTTTSTTTTSTSTTTSTTTIFTTTRLLHVVLVGTGSWFCGTFCCSDLSYRAFDFFTTLSKYFSLNSFDSLVNMPQVTNHSIKKVTTSRKQKSNLAENNNNDNAKQATKSDDDSRAASTMIDRNGACLVWFLCNFLFVLLCGVNVSRRALSFLLSFATEQSKWLRRIRLLMYVLMLFGMSCYLLKRRVFRYRKLTAASNNNRRPQQLPRVRADSKACKLVTYC